MIHINIPKKVNHIMDVIGDYSHSVYVVGGCIRDSILGITPKDWDIATSMRPEIVIAAFNNLGYTVVPTGLKHGTVTIVIDGEHFEVTTYRKDGVYSDGRRPDDVVFTHDINEDLSRRDFTINAMAYNEDGLIDPFNGYHDLQAKFIRAVGNPSERFKEDGLRMLRAIRFSSTLGFHIAPSTYRAICEKYRLLKDISVERKREELYKILLSDNAHYGIRHLINTGLMDYIIHEISDMTFPKLDEIPQYYGLRLAYLLLDFHEDKVREILNKLKVDNETKRLVINGINAYDQIDDKLKLTRSDMKMIIRVYGSHELWGALLIAKTIHESKHGRYNEMMRQFLNIMENNKNGKEPIWIKDLDVKGNDLIDLGFEGKQIGEMLNRILDFVTIHPIENDKSKLVQQIEGGYFNYV